MGVMGLFDCTDCKAPQGEPEATASVSLRGLMFGTPWLPSTSTSSVTSDSSHTLVSSTGHRSAAKLMGQSAKHWVPPVQLAKMHASPTSHCWFPHSARGGGGPGGGKGSLRDGHNAITCCRRNQTATQPMPPASVPQKQCALTTQSRLLQESRRTAQLHVALSRAMPLCPASDRDRTWHAHDARWLGPQGLRPVRHSHE
jgi:hypothetical protein